MRLKTVIETLLFIKLLFVFTAYTFDMADANLSSCKLSKYVSDESPLKL